MSISLEERLATFHRGRRFRRSERLRDSVRETWLRPQQLVLPLFCVSGSGRREPIDALPGHARLSADLVADAAMRADALRLGGLLLFGIPDTKDSIGSSGWDPDGPVPAAIRAAKAAAPQLPVWADVCLCEYTDHGHCGVLEGDHVANDATLPLLARAAVAYAEAGADVIAPSDMMDGRVGSIRDALDEGGFADTILVSYAVKYASAYYGPFREAAGSTPAFGDRRGYQMDPANRREAVLEALADIDEGADAVMVKPAGPYLDVVREVRDAVDVPVVAYQVSGEYAMIRAAAERGWIDGDRVMRESLVGIARAGAGVIITYFAGDFAAAEPESA